MGSFCDDRCTNASGNSCDCECGGQNHGAFAKAGTAAVGGSPSGGSEVLFASDRSEREVPLVLSDRELKSEIRSLQAQAHRLAEQKDKYSTRAEAAAEGTSIEKRYSELLAEQKRRDQGGAQLGTVSHGTMQPRDLIPEFRSVLADLDQKAYRKHLEEHGDVTGDEDKDEAKGLDSEEAGWALEDLFDKLESCAPDGAYFGAHPGDGSDYGFWLVEE